MPSPGDSRRRPTILLASGVLVVFVLLGTLQWFNTSKVDFLNPETYGQTIFLTALEGLLFLLLLLLLVLLFRTILKVYVGPSFEWRVERPGHAAAHGAGRHHHRHHACGAHVSVQLLPDEPLDGTVVLAQRVAIARRLHARGAGVDQYVAITGARLELAPGRTGTVLVVEDTAELLRAQRRWRGRKWRSALPTKSRTRSRPSRSAPSA